jgi:WhiB family transcriptional regulator, redox-sensing transcriptional regulator
LGIGSGAAGGLVEVSMRAVDTSYQDWRAFAACAGSDPDVFFAPGALEHKLAKKVCRHCPVRSQCLAYAMDERLDHGVWGGLTERERRRYRRQAPAGDWRALIA